MAHTPKSQSREAYETALAVLREIDWNWHQDE